MDTNDLLILIEKVIHLSNTSCLVILSPITYYLSTITYLLLPINYRLLPISYHILILFIPGEEGLGIGADGDDLAAVRTRKGYGSQHQLPGYPLPFETIEHARMIDRHGLPLPEICHLPNLRLLAPRPEHALASRFYVFNVYHECCISFVLFTTLNLSFIRRNGISKYLYDNPAINIVSPVTAINTAAKHTPPLDFEPIRFCLMHPLIILFLPNITILTFEIASSYRYITLKKFFIFSIFTSFSAKLHKKQYTQDRNSFCILQYILRLCPIRPPPAP